VLQFKNPWLAYFAAANALLAVLITASIVPGDQLFSLSTGGLFPGEQVSPGGNDWLIFGWIE